MEVRLEVDLLGQFRVRRGDRELPELDTPRLRALLGRLALDAGRALDRGALAFELWPDSTEARARGSLRKLLHSLARRLPDLGTFVEVNDRALTWRADAPALVDALEFERLAASRRPADWRRAAALYGGPLLPGTYDPWLLAERARLADLLVTLLGRLARDLEARGGSSGGPPRSPSASCARRPTTRAPGWP